MLRQPDSPMPYLLPLTALGLLVTFLLGLWLVSRSHKKAMANVLQKQQALAQELKRLQHAIQVQDEGLHELRTGTLGVGNRVKELAVTLEQTREKMTELSNQDPDNRIYGKAARLVDSGASVEELMAECDLPRGEAELLFAMHQQKQR